MPDKVIVSPVKGDDDFAKTMCHSCTGQAHKVDVATPPSL